MIASLPLPSAESMFSMLKYATGTDSRNEQLL
jgi:hypothetical protein